MGLSLKLFSFVITNSSSYNGKLGVMVDGNCDLCRMCYFMNTWKLIGHLSSTIIVNFGC